MPHAVVITGPPGAGKSTVARLVAEALVPSVHLHADDFFAHVVGGFVEPWLPEAHSQNEAVIRAVLAAAEQFWNDGFNLVLDGVIGPWFAPTLLARLRSPSLIDYVVLLPSLEVLHSRVASREGHGFHDRDATEHMYGDFDRARQGFERHIIDNTSLGAEQVAQAIRERLGTGDLALARTV